MVIKIIWLDEAFINLVRHVSVDDSCIEYMKSYKEICLIQNVSNIFDELGEVDI
jgi:hypothetical protein